MTMPRRALGALAAVLLTALVAAAPGAVAGETPAPPTPPPASASGPASVQPFKQINGDGVVFQTVTPGGSLFDDLRTNATSFVLLDRPCDKVPLEVSLLPTAVAPTAQGLYRAGSPPPAPAIVDVSRVPAGAPRDGPKPYCVGLLHAEIGKTDPAQGTLILNVEAPVATPPARTDPVVSWVKYSVQRSTSYNTYLALFAIAFGAGMIVLSIIRYSLWSAWNEDPRKLLPETYSYEKPWASAATFLSAVGTPLLAGSGVLTSLSPQYQTTGIVVANVVVAALLAVGPILVAAFYTRGNEVPLGEAFGSEPDQLRRRRVLGAVGAFVAWSFTAQLLINAVYLLTTGLTPLWLVIAVGALVWILAAFFLWKVLARDLPSDPPLTATPAAGV